MESGEASAAVGRGRLEATIRSGGILDDLTTKPPKRMLHLLKIMKSLPH